MLSNIQWYYGTPHTWSNNRVLQVTWSARKDTHEIIRQTNFPSKESPLHASHRLCLSKSHQKHPQELHLIWLLCSSWCSGCSKIVFVWQQVSLYGTENGQQTCCQVNKVSDCAKRHCNLTQSASLSQQNKLISKIVWNTMHADLPLSQIFFKNLTNPLFINQYLMLYQCEGHVTVSIYQAMNFSNCFHILCS